MKYRKNKTKKEHGMIKGLDKLLVKVSKIDGVKSIVPGRIKPSKNAEELYLTIQYKTESGIKCIAKGEGVQEVFIVCAEENSDKIIEAINEGV